MRRATAEDVPALFSIRTSVVENHLDIAQLAARGVTSDSVKAMLDRDTERVWVAEDKNVVVAFSMADATTGTVFALFVHPLVQGRGYGRALLRVAEDWLFSTGWETAWLNTDQSPTRAHEFYRAAGWVMVGPADHGDVRYEKDLRSAASGALSSSA